MPGIDTIPRMDEKKSSNRPSHVVYLVREGVKKDDKASWNRIGAAWLHQDGKGLNVVLDGDLVVRERKSQDAEGSDDK